MNRLEKFGNMPTIFRNIVLFGLMVLMVSLFWTNNSLIFLLLLIEFLFSMFFFYSKTEKAFFLATGIFGLSLEIIGGILGIWVYAKPNFFTVPIWIFFCWGFTFMLLLSLSETIAFLYNNKKAIN